MKKSDELKQLLAAAKAKTEGLKNAVEIKASIEEIKDLKAQIELAEMQEEDAEKEVQNKLNVKPANPTVKESANAVRAMIKKGMGQSLTEAENALLVGGTNGEGYILPQDIRTKIVALVRQYKSFRDVLGHMPTTDLTGSFPVEDFETVSELIDFTDGTDGTEANDIKWKNISFALKQKGALIKLSNTLLKMTDNDLINYVAQVFAKKAVITENKLAVAALKTGKTVKQIADWKALKKSINVDLDEAVKYGLCICTNQDGFDVLDSALDSFGRPVLQPDPSQPTRKLFMGAPVEVFSNALLLTTGTTTKKAPLFYGNCSEAVKFVDNGQYAFATSEHAGFNSNTTVARVIEYVDVIQVDASDKIYIVAELTVA